ncbi:helix-turn-helix transcriptional regulator [Oculatella sp. LEGE 06141]|uniref:helix-turn-helix transcriptional regulator n=1 Tax=Oculatella sp. LEGE 06141 TaxID=1828648 RepID=UPI00187E0585|nr:helix-turn-helix transcriptional regulator [Oculatella sp. LEGE 06141]MBE9182985.1 helix-turn-helix transcriptional regulator [Oculatella sp. LEGE 06141]
MRDEIQGNSVMDQEITTDLLPWRGGSKLRQARIRMGYTQAEFAQKINSAESTVRYWEKNKRVPKWNRTKKETVAQVLNLPVEEILTWFETEILAK